MILAVDVGNTDTKFGVFAGSELAARWALHSDLNRTREEYVDLIRAMLAYRGADGVDAAVIGSVVPGLTPVITEAVAAVTGSVPLLPDPEAVPGISLRVDVPAQVGIDRVANAYAARDIYGAPAIVADLGSVTTFDVIDRAGDLSGVIIALGMLTSARTLTSSGAKLPNITVERPSTLVGANTVASMQSGVYWGYVHMVRGFIRQLRDELGSDFRAIATGGLARVVKDDVGVFDEVDADITLRGLMLIKAAIEQAA